MHNEIAVDAQKKKNIDQEEVNILKEFWRPIVVTWSQPIFAAAKYWL